MKAEILKFVAERENVSFAELSRKIEGFSGELGMFTPPYVNVVLWPAVSSEGIAALAGLLAEKKIRMKPCSVLIYHTEGMVPAFPIAKDAKMYKTERWLPVVFSTVPEKKPAKRAAKRLQ